MIRKSLSYRVLVLDPIPFADTEKTPEGEARMFQPIAVTLITGDTDAVLVDPPMNHRTNRSRRQVGGGQRQALEGDCQPPRPRGSLVRDGHAAEAFPRG